MAGLKRYQTEPRHPRPEPAPIAATAGRATLRDYEGDGPAVILVPSLINPPHVLDLQDDNSLLRWLGTQGLHPYLVDWGEPDGSERNVSIGDHVEQYLIPLIRTMRTPPLLVGYCLGGTMAMAAASFGGICGLATIAAPWNFAGFPPDARSSLIDLWTHAEPAAESLGLLPMEILQTSFWRLDPARTVSKFERLGRGGMPEEAVPGFIALEDWANNGPPLTLAAGRELLVDLFREDRTGRGKWRVGGRPVIAQDVPCPVLDIISTTDRIVPAASSHGQGQRILLNLGHVGMIVGGRARRLLWEPLADWLRRTAQGAATPL